MVFGENMIFGENIVFCENMFFLWKNGFWWIHGFWWRHGFWGKMVFWSKHGFWWKQGLWWKHVFLENSFFFKIKPLFWSCNLIPVLARAQVWFNLVRCNLILCLSCNYSWASSPGSAGSWEWRRSCPGTLSVSQPVL